MDELVPIWNWRRRRRSMWSHMLKARLLQVRMYYMRFLRGTGVLWWWRNHFIILIIVQVLPAFEVGRSLVLVRGSVLYVITLS